MVPVRRYPEVEVLADMDAGQASEALDEQGDELLTRSSG